MKQLLLAGLLSIMLLPSFSYAKENTENHVATQEQHRVVSHASSKSQYTQPVDINHADATQLATLKGIGPKKADAIIAYRTKNGSFQTVADLAKVKGIGAKSVARLQKNNPGRLVVNMSAKVA